MNVYRPAPTIGAPFIVRRFNADGTLASEIPFLYQSIAEELLALHLSNGHTATLTAQ